MFEVVRLVFTLLETCFLFLAGIPISSRYWFWLFIIIFTIILITFITKFYQVKMEIRNQEPVKKSPLIQGAVSGMC